MKLGPCEVTSQGALTKPKGHEQAAPESRGFSVAGPGELGGGREQRTALRALLNYWR